MSGTPIRLSLILGVACAACSEPIAVEWRHDLEAASVSTPLVTDAYIAVGSELGVHVVELDGSPRCFFDAHGEVISAPQTDGKTIFFGSTNYIFYAISPTCTETWKFAARDRIKSDPLVGEGLIYTTSYDGHVYALKADSGELAWTFPSSAPPPAPKPSPVQDDESTDKEQEKKAADEASEEGAPPSPPPPKPVTPGDFSYSSPALHAGVLYVGNLDHHLYALDGKTGAMRWRFKTEGPVTSSPKIRDEVLYFGSNDGSIYALDLSSGTRKWKLATQDWVNSSPRLADGSTFYIGGNDRRLYAVDAAKGTATWTFPTKGPVVGTPTVYENLVFAGGGSGDGTIYAVDRATGKEFWRYETGGKIDADPVVKGDRLYVASADKTLYAFTIERTTVAQ